jgi:DNA-binding NarL/FixJ family response regulator
MGTLTAIQRDNTFVPWGDLPPRMRVLLISGRQRTGGWLADALSADRACEIQLEQAAGPAAGLTRLRDEPFDAALVSHEPGELDALDLIEGIRAGSSEQLPIIVLGCEPEQEMAALAFEAGADAYVCIRATTTRTFIWQLARARQWHQLITENRQLAQQQRHRLKQEHDEAGRLLKQQRALIHDLEQIRGAAESEGIGSGGVPPEMPLMDRDRPLPVSDSLIAHYRELLKTYVVMGTGNLTAEMERLSGVLVAAGVTAQQAMELHLRVLEEMVEGLGTRSARHVMNRADLLVLEVMIHLAEGYRKRVPKHGETPPTCCERV